MKKVLIAIILLLLIAIIFQTCWYQKYCRGAGTTNPPNTFCESAACYGQGSAELEGLVEFAAARRMAELYAQDISKNFVWHNGVKTDSLDARSIWFDLKRIKSFIGYIEAKLCKDSCIKTDGYGIRMYYAKYPDTVEMRNYRGLEDVPAAYANRHTLFMVPTYWDEARGLNIDFDPMITVNNCKLRPIDSTTKEIFSTYFVVGTGGTEQQNHGSLIPPPAGKGNFPQN